MTDGIKPHDCLIGPFKHWNVVVDGRVVPKLTGRPESETMTCLVLDGRFSVSLANRDVHSVAWMIANALAIGEGYSHVGAASKDRPFAPQSMKIAALPPES